MAENLDARRSHILFTSQARPSSGQSTAGARQPRRLACVFFPKEARLEILANST